MSEEVRKDKNRITKMEASNDGEREKDMSVAVLLENWWMIIR